MWRYLLTCVLIPILLQSCSSGTDKNFFNKKDLTGWSSSQMQYWSVEDSAIVGKATEEVPRNQFLWSSVKVKDFYLSVDVQLDSADKNAGIQFRSKKADDYGQAIGYQADIGLNYGVNIWGTLYHEHGRGLLHTSDPEKTIVKNGDWNHYEILAVGHKIWIAVNGNIISATEDTGGEEEGYIALQIHSGPAQTVRYKINKLVHNPEIKLAGKDKKELDNLLHKPLVPAEGQSSIKLKPGNTVAFAGGTNIVNMQSDGYLETLLTYYFPGSPIRFRNMGWEGDNVYEQFRDVGFGDWKHNLDSLNPDVVFVQFGQMEALDGIKKLPDFISAYKKLLNSIKKDGRKIVVLSPIDYEKTFLKINDSAQWNDPLKKTDLQYYFNAIQLMAQTEGYSFVDLYLTLRPGRTYDGIHLNDHGQKAVAEMTMSTLGLGVTYNPKLDSLRYAIIKKNKIWFNYWRPGNWAFLNGDRTEQAFSRDWKDQSKRIFPDEIKQIAPLLVKAEKEIDQIKADPPARQSPPSEGWTGRNTTEQNPSYVPAGVGRGETPHSIEEELASFKLHEDYNIELYASEALGMADPCTMRWDEKGRLWVLCIPTYPQPLPGQPANDKLIVLEDKNNDGKADASTVFADNLDIPLGFELGNNGVYLGEQTKLLFLKDTNNDLKNDVTQTLLSGFGTHDSHQTINSFTWSPGGELFFAQGLSIHSAVETPWGIKTAHRGGIWRYRPAAHQLDNILDQSTASDNPWGMTFGDYGEFFTKSNDTGIYFTSAALILTDHKALVPEIGATQIKSGSIAIPRSSHIPADLRNDILIAGYYNNKVERLKLTENGAGYKAKIIEPLLSSTGKNFRPVDIKTGPDGAIYILDWYNPIIGHYQASLRDPQRDKTHGRIWKITAKNRDLLKTPELFNKTIPYLLDQLKSDEYWTRYQVRRLLAAKSSTEVLPEVDKWIKSTTNERDVMEALAVYETFETINEPLLKQLLKAKNPGARGYAVQLAGRWSDRINDPLALIKPLITDNHPRARLMALVACSNIHTTEAMNVAVRILKYPMDKFTNHAFDKTIFALKDAWEPAFRNNSFKFENNNQLATVISVLTPEWCTAKTYRDLLKSGEYSAAVKTNLLKALANIGSADDIEYILSLPFTQTNVSLIEAIGKKEFKQVNERTAAYIKNILNKSLSNDLTLAAIKLGKAANVLNTDILNKYISNPSKSIRISAINGLARLNLTHGLTETMKEIKKNNGDIGDMRETIIAIIYEPGGINALNKEIKKQGIDGPQASALLVALDQKHVSDKNLLQTIAKFESKQQSIFPKGYNEQYTSQLAAKAKKASAADGEKIYNTLTCVACHKIKDRGGNIGPNLSAIGSGLSMPDIITEVLWPNKNIKEGFNSVGLELKNGESMQGIKVLENGESISIKSSASAPPVSIKKKDIANITAIGSAMPEGLVNSITEDELASLIKYLSQQR
jgi:putative heme-binding domain-containing protein